MVEKNRVFQIIINMTLILVCIFCVAPIVLLIASSLSSEITLIKNGYSFWPREIDFSAYKYLLTGFKDIARGYGISVFVTVVGTITNLVLTTLFAYPLSRKNLPGRSFISFFLFFTMLFNGGIVASYMMWTSVFHIKNTIFALIIPNFMMGAFNVIMMRTYLTTSIPEEIIEAARIDGLGEFGILRKIIIPMSKTIISTLALLVGLTYWNDWVNGLYYINDNRLYSIQVLLYRMLMDSSYLLTSKLGSMMDSTQMPSTAIKMAIATLGILPVLIVYPFLQRYLVKGITIGAVKG